MNSVTVSAPGKLMLFGEHAVVYDRPCLVTAMDTRLCLSVERNKEKEVRVESFNVQDTRFIDKAFSNFIEKYPLKNGVKISTVSSFSSQFGFGSSSASTVCVLKALSELSGEKLNNNKLFDIAYKTVLDVQGKGSGFDVASAIYGGTLYFVTGGKIIELLKVKEMPLVIGYTGVKADTVTLVNEVREKMKAQPERIERIYDAIAKLTNDAKEKMLEGPACAGRDWERVGKFMDFNQEYLRDLGVSSEKLEALISAAKNAGALGAKLSGAGGGDCMIALVTNDTRASVEGAIEKAGGQVIRVNPNAQGVRVEA